MKKLMVVAVAALAGAAFSSGVPTEIQTGANTMKLTTSSSGDSNGFTNALHWTAIGGGNAVAPCTHEDPMNPNPDAKNYDYWIPSGFSMRTHKDSNSRIPPSGSKPLTVGGRSWHLAGGITPATSFNMAPLSFPDLYLYDASFFSLNTFIGLSNTTIHVMSANNNPHYLKPSSNLSFTYQRCKIVGESGTAFKLTTDTTTTANITANYYFIDTDFSDYKGELFIGADNTKTPSVCSIRRSASNRSSPMEYPGAVYVGNSSGLAEKASSFKIDNAGLVKIGTMTLSENASLECGGEGRGEFKTLTLKAGTSLSFTGVNVPTEPYVTIKTTLALPSTPIAVTASLASDAAAGTYTLIKDETGTLTEDKLSLSPFAEPDFAFVFENANGVSTLSVVKTEWITMTTADASGSAAGALLQNDTGAGYWSDGTPVHGDAYYKTVKSTLSFCADAANGVPTPYVFPGIGLWACTVNDMHFQSIKDITFTNLWVTPRTEFTCYTGTIIPLRGERFVLLSNGTGKTIFHCYQNGGFSITAPVEGDGVIAPRWRGKNHSMGYFEMTALNTNYIGKVYVYCMGNPGSDDYTPMSTKNIVLNVYDQRNLGGPIPSGATAPVYDALQVRDRQVMEAKGNAANGNVVTFDEKTRGIYVPWWSRFSAREGVTLELKQQITYEGRLEKIGKGTLALGGTTKFTSSLLDTPYVSEKFLTGTNELVISEGALKPLNTAAFAGVAVIFSNATTLVIAPSVDEGVAQYGLKATAAGSSVSVVEGGMVSVEIDYGDMPAALLPSSGKKVAICTVKDAEASAVLRQKFSILPRSGVTAELSTEAADGIDGAYTVYATLSCKGPTVTENCAMDCSKLTLELDIADACGADKLTVALKQGDVVKGTEDVTPLAVGLREVVFDGLSAGDYTYQIKLSGTYKGEAFIREEEPVSVTLATPLPVTPQDGKFSLSANAEVDMANTVAGSYAVSSATGKKCHLKWTDANGKYAVMSEGTLEVMEGRPENGLDSFMSYVLGLDPTDSTATTYIAAENDNDPNWLTLTMPKVVNPRPESETGVEVSYAVQTSSDPSFSSYETGITTKENSFKASLPTAEGKVRYYRVQINMR